MKNKYIRILIICIMLVPQWMHATYMTTATSISWSGAYSSIADGLEAVLYNPAGVAMSRHRFGLNILGSYSFRFYNNSLSTKDAITFLQKNADGDNMTDFFHSMLDYMPTNGFNTGVEMSLLNFISFFKFKHFSLGISVLPKTKVDMTLSKSFFSSLMDKIDLTEKLNMSSTLTALQYFDFDGSVSTRVKFLEKAMHVDGVYAGVATHIYVPTVFMSVVLDDISVSKFQTNNQLGLYGFHINMSGKSKVSVNKAVSAILKSTGVLSDNEDMSTLAENSGTVGIGLGWDMGAIVQIKKWVRVGLSVTDLGFIAFPQTCEVDTSITTDLTMDPTDNQNGFSSFTNFSSSITDGLKNAFASKYQTVTSTCFMPDTAIRFGVAFTPVLNKFIDITAAADISVTDLNKCLNGNPPTFNFSTGVEVLPRVNWFEFVFRTAFSYNTEANNPAFSFGTGLHLGALQMEIGIKGLESLFRDIGAKEVIAGLDLKFVF